ncbi:circularly permuted type 2 ATP-grasp protein [Methylobacillus arboreus]|uniref:circularly permuted type 2 ATP-grasp protein n=1 Tax=Methylobacillus arboreus TaxID=755170 RepID=UPI001E28BC55|nr:circularly permuted type 2 ATP-grasp protein [Methylobacillus arboreus]MCB5191260.1 circularly permuted type 2 ATP-grasp protein [Methylobacillus arboreus]
MLHPILQTYPSQQHRHDELMQPTGTPRLHWQALIETLEELSPEQMCQRVEAIRHQVRENGVTYNVYADTKGLQRPWGLDILPFILPQEEWQTIESAVIQRATLMNAILNDIYGPQQLMQDGLLPPALVHGHAGFLRPCHGIRLPDDYALHMYAVDMARSPDGQWWVVGDRTQAPSGAGYALENRVIISSAFPELFRDLNVQRLGGFFSSMRDSLAYWGHQVATNQSANNPQINPLGDGEHPLIVLLTPGPYNETYHEQSYLAGYLGFPLVQGSDLTVRNGIVWMKTLSGLRPVHAILRRLDDDFCDPLELNPDSLLGVPGLNDAARRGNVLIANSLGSNLLQTGALLGFLPNLCQHLLGQSLLMPSVATWWCGEPQALETVISNLENLVIKPAFPQIREVPIFGDDLSPTQRAELEQKLRNNPQNYVAQEQVEISQAPVWSDSEPASLKASAIGLRVYACATPQGYVVMPGGLTRVGSTQDERVLSMQRGGTSKDTWIISPADNDYRSLLRKSTSSQDLIHSNIHLSSRMVENLFWFGRYSVRNHHYTRLLRTAIRRLLEFSSTQRSTEWPTIQALCTWYGLMAMEKPEDHQDAPELNDESIEALLISGIFSIDQGQPSLANHMQQFFTLAFNLRERLSSDNWRSINQMVKRFGLALPSPTLADAILLLDETSTSLVTLAGFALDGMTRDQGWRFLSIGRRIERLQLLCTLLRNALIMPPESNLEWLLELCDSIVTYRSRYAAQAEWLPALDLLLLDENNPNSMTFQLKGLIKYLSQISTTYGSGGEGPFIEQLSTLRTLDPDTHLSPGNSELIAWLNNTFEASVTLSDALSHRFFSYSGTLQEHLQKTNIQQEPLHF